MEAIDLEGEVEDDDGGEEAALDWRQEAYDDEEALDAASCDVVVEE